MSQCGTFSEDRGAKGCSYSKTSIRQVAGEFRLRILAGVLTIKISSPCESAFLAMLLVQPDAQITGNMHSTIDGGLYHASNEDELVAALYHVQYHSDDDSTTPLAI